MRGELVRGVLSAFVLLAGCAGPPQVDWPAGTGLVVQVAAARPLLHALGSLHNTPVAGWADGLGQRLDLLDCEVAVLCCALDQPCAPLRDLRCADSADAAQTAALGDSAWLLRHHSPGAWWGEARWQQGDGSDGELQGHITVLDEDRVPWAGLLPAEPDGNGLARLSSDEALLHLRAVPRRGLRLPVSGERSSVADDLFRLRNDLFTAAVLAGDLEVAIYSPRPGQVIPPVALAAGVRQEQTAVAAMEAFLRDVAQRWSLSRRPWTLGERRGACLDELRVLPDLAPCYLAGTDALFLGWNPSSLELALAAGERRESGPGSFAELYLDRLPAADAVLAGTGGGAAPTVYPWQRLHVEGATRDGRIELRASLGEAP